ncbi:bifunctional DNA primase/polymerase [Streptomyces sp. NPDC006996]|uniref:bifunctional DNA primase/polymerase n=1 Tax=Streptomyces sp. NPDC006996 TaxID=3156908 RepID=UPI0033E53DBC
MTTDMQRPPVATTEARQNELPVAKSENQDLGGTQVVPGGGTDPFRSAWQQYREAGWLGTLKLPTRAKASPPTGYTGADGAWPTDDECASWSGNIGLRVTANVVGIDVDHGYPDKSGRIKQGASQLAELEAKLGELPPTWTSTRRGEGPSRIRFYRVPEGRKWPTKPAADIEVIQYGHRYAVAWPSVVHEDDKTNTGPLLTYRWYDPEGNVSDRVPTVDELPELPAGWADNPEGWHLREDAPALVGEVSRPKDALTNLWADDPSRGNDWLTQGAGELLAVMRGRKQLTEDTAKALLRAVDTVSDQPQSDTEVLKIWESVKKSDERNHPGMSAAVVAAKLAKGDMDVAEAVEAWDEFDEKVFNDIAGMYIRDIAKAKYLGHLAALMERSPEEYDATPYARMQLFERAAWHRADGQAKILAAPGNTDLGEPDDWDECEEVERDFSGSGLFIQPGWLSLVIGDYESAKTMLFLWAAAERLRRGETVIFIDEESPKDQTFDKLSAFQLTPEQRAGFKRYGHRGWNLAAHPEMLDKLMERHPEATLIGADSVSRLMSNSGLEDDNAGAMKLWTNIEQFVSRFSTVAFYLIDHQGMNGGKHARGASVKVQQSSIAVRLATKTKFTKTEDGQFTAEVLKHRNGLSAGHTFQVDVTTTAPGPLEMYWTDKGGSKVEPKSGVPGGDWGPLEFKLMTHIKAAKGEWVSESLSVTDHYVA